MLDQVPVVSSTNKTDITEILLCGKQHNLNPPNLMGIKIRLHSKFCISLTSSMTSLPEGVPGVE
jgi:hypothetical protein